MKKKRSKMKISKCGVDAVRGEHEMTMSQQEIARTSSIH